MNEDKHIHESTPDGFPDELISAYLDGEVSPAEKLRVEEQLMDSAAHRQLFDELKSLRNSLQALPEASLDRDFASRVLGRAEQQLLTEDVQPKGETNAKPPADAPVVCKSSGADSWRGLIWSVAAIAAAVMLIVFGPLYTQRENNRPVVKHDPVVESFETGAAARRDSEIATGEAEQLQAGKEDNARGASREVAKDQANKNREVQSLKSQASDDAVPSAPPALAMESAEGVKEAANDMRQPRANQLSAAIADADNAPGSAAFAGDAAMPAVASRTSANEFKQETARYEYADMMVVSVDVTPEALSRHFMDGLLQKHAIQTELARADLPGEMSAAKENKDAELQLDGKALEKSKQQDAQPQHAQADDFDSVARRAQRDELAQRKQFPKQEKERLAKAGGDVDLMVVVATPQQVQQLLGDMRTQHGDVLAMTYDRPVENAGRKKRQQASADAKADRGRSFGGGEPAEDAHAGIANAFGAPETTSAGAAARNVPSADRELSDGIAAAPVVAPSTDKQAGSPPVPARPTYREGELPPQDAESFRGIARRLHLPEDFQKLLAQPQPQVAASEIEGQGQGSGVGAGEARLGGTTAELAEAKKPAEAAKGDAEQPLMRVLFVLRAANRTPTAPLADRVPAEISPANAALQEPATSSADTAAPVDE